MISTPRHAAMMAALEQAQRALGDVVDDYVNPDPMDRLIVDTVLLYLQDAKNVIVQSQERAAFQHRQAEGLGITPAGE